MNRSFRLTAAAAAVCVFASTAAAQDSKAAAAALETWVRSYDAGRLDLSKPRINKNSPGVKSGIVDSTAARSMTHAKELEEICRVARNGEPAVVVPLLLELAGIGLAPDDRLTLEMRPPEVRAVAERTLDKLDAAAALVVIEDTARTAASTANGAAMQAAALRALGRRQKTTFEPTIEQGFGSEYWFVRAAAFSAARDLKSMTMLPALTRAALTESQDTALALAFDAMLAAVREHQEKVAPDVRRQIADAAIAALGRTTWRADLAAVAVLAKVRSAQAVPALIAALARCNDPAADEESRSGLLRFETHATLRSLTGAVFPEDQPQQWSDWWLRTKDSFEVLEEPKTEKPSDSATSTADFFGIPVRGSRVLFIIDVSGSMAEGMHGRTGTSGGAANKLDAAKIELMKAVNGLTVDCAFNVVKFSNNAEMWQRDMVQADAKAKKLFEKFIEGLRPDGGTNLWEGMADGLKFKSLVYGDRYGVSYDELFILSDGLPTLGDVQRPQEILRLVEETNQASRLRINTIYISGDPQVEKRFADQLGMNGAEFMRKMAEQNFGRSVTL